MLEWSTAAPAIGAAFLASVVEVVEAFTIVLVVATLRGWKPAIVGTIAALVVLGAVVVILGPLLDQVPLNALQLVIGVLLLLFGIGWLRKAALRAGSYRCTTRMRFSRASPRISARRCSGGRPRKTGSQESPRSRRCFWKGSRSSSSSSRSARDAA